MNGDPNLRSGDTYGEREPLRGDTYGDLSINGERDLLDGDKYGELDKTGDLDRHDLLVVDPSGDRDMEDLSGETWLLFRDSFSRRSLNSLSGMDDNFSLKSPIVSLSSFSF